jgi:dienelactone hydrolase
MPHELVLFHSAQGLRPSVLDWAARLRAAGHVVHTPDLFDGEVFEKLEDGVKKRDALGIPELMRRTQQSVAKLGAELVYLGFSMGAAGAQFLAATRPGARGVVLMHGALPPAMLGLERWPEVPVQVHYAERDPWVEAPAVTALEQAARAAGVRTELHVYPGSGHLFADVSSPDYDAKSAALMFERVRAFVAEL